MIINHLDNLFQLVFLQQWKSTRTSRVSHIYSTEKTLTVSKEPPLCDFDPLTIKLTLYYKHQHNSNISYTI